MSQGITRHEHDHDLEPEPDALRATFESTEPPPSYEKAARDQAPPFSSGLNAEASLYKPGDSNPEDDSDTYSDLDHAWGPPTSQRHREPSSSKKPAVQRAASAVKKGIEHVKNIVGAKARGSCSTRGGTTAYRLSPHKTVTG